MRSSGSADHQEALRPLVISQQFHRIEDELALVRIGRLAEDASDLDAVGRLESPRNGVGAVRFGDARRIVVVAFQLVVEILDGNAQNARNLEQAAGAYPIRAFLVFLYLLEGDSE